MSGLGAKLSRHVLGMKFMRKTKDQVDKEKVEKVHREHFAPATSVKSENKLKHEQSTPSAVPVVVEELWSYNQCERYIFGRQSFGGFNPTVENNVKKGIWKPFYLDEAANSQCDSEDEEKGKQEDVDVSDEEMAKTYGSLVGTLAKHFRKKHKKEAEEEEKHEDDNVDNNEMDSRKSNKKKRWNKRFQRNKNKDRFDLDGQQRQGHHGHQNQNQQHKKNWNKQDNRKRQRESTGSTHYNDQRQGGKVKKSPFSTPGYSQDQDEKIPPTKKRKFMKPSDD